MESITLNNGKQMPKIGLGLGVWKPGDTDLEMGISSALEAGYRHFDTAFMYITEIPLGKCVNEWIQSGKGKREDLFITTKLPWNGMEPQLVSHFLNLSLESLGLTYVDLYLMNWPIGFKHTSDRDFIPKDTDGDFDMDNSTSLEDIWRAMEEEIDKGKTRAIGISNFNVPQIKRILNICRIQPANLQVEVHLYFQQGELRTFCEAKGISVTSYAPLGSPWLKDDQKPIEKRDVNLLKDPILTDLAQKYNKEAGQVALKFLLEKNAAVIPKSFNTERIKLNHDLFDFHLDSEDMEKLEALDSGDGGRIWDLRMGNSKSHPEFPFKPLP